MRSLPIKYNYHDKTLQNPSAQGMSMNGFIVFIQHDSLTSMTAEDLFIDNGSNGQAVETVCKGLPELDVETTLA